MPWRSTTPSLRSDGALHAHGPPEVKHVVTDVREVGLVLQLPLSVQQIAVRHVVAAVARHAVTVLVGAVAARWGYSIG